MSEDGAPDPYADLGTVDLSGEVVFDLYDRVDEILEEDLPALREEAESAREQAREAREAAEAAEERDRARSLRQDAAALEQEAEAIEEDAASLEHTAEVFHTAAQEWGGSEFVFTTNLSFGETLDASDTVTSLTVASGEPLQHADAKQGAHQKATLMKGTVRKPPDAPDYAADGFPWQVGQWLYQRFEAQNETGGVGLGNSSQTPEQTGSESGR